MAKLSQHVVQQAELSSDPTTPPSGYQIIYPKTDGKVYARNSAGTITEITNVAGGGGANTALSNLASVAINASLLPASDTTLEVGAAGGNAWLNVLTRTLQLKGVNSGVVSIKAANPDAGTWSFFFPTGAPAANNSPLVGNTDGSTSWQSPINNPLMVQIFS